MQLDIDVQGDNSNPSAGARAVSHSAGGPSATDESRSLASLADQSMGEGGEGLAEVAGPTIQKIPPPAPPRETNTKSGAEPGGVMPEQGGVITVPGMAVTTAGAVAATMAAAGELLIGGSGGVGGGREAGNIPSEGRSGGIGAWSDMLHRSAPHVLFIQGQLLVVSVLALLVLVNWRRYGSLIAVLYATPSPQGVGSSQGSTGERKRD